MGVFIAEIAVLLIVLGAVAYPLLGAAAPVSSPELIENDLSDLLYRKEALYTALKDLEFDMRTGKIDQEDYDVMKKSLEAEAIGILGMIDATAKGENPGSDEKKSEKKKGKFCPECGSKVEKSHKFCPECANKL
ncbi:MAG: zinc ribbon domain-containing protein [Nitrospinota bacterium]|nr:zinc ribbon domain-containing protein [Nitrospinota bacterium]MDH5677836.1 zinc ribbon domain-containing protein [Nitrospinota bacterium]MDH5756425.1 zinc ribbon domain-containing protein [Nitrospinota bacterium]